MGEDKEEAHEYYHGNIVLVFHVQSFMNPISKVSEKGRNKLGFFSE